MIPDLSDPGQLRWLVYRALDEADDIVIVAQRQRRGAGEPLVISVNQAFHHTTGFTQEDMLGQSLTKLVVPDSRDHAQAMLIQAMNEPRSTRTELQCVNKNGKILWLGLHVMTLPQIDPDCCVVLGRDITEALQARRVVKNQIFQLNAMLKQKVEDLEAANKELETFSYSVSHELRIPLRAIDGFSKILLEDHAGQLDAEGRRLIGIVRDGTGKMAHLINDILEFSVASRPDLTVTKVDMNGLVQEVLHDLAPMIGGRNLRFVIQPVAPIHGDMAMLKRVWSNLIENAIKYTGPKKDAVIEVAAAVEPGKVVYHVKDNGVGFDMQYAEKIFGLFQRLHRASEIAGTGVGLAIVKRLVIRHGGWVWAEGQRGTGAIFYFSLPEKGLA